jgi:hypothetical protein
MIRRLGYDFQLSDSRGEWRTKRNLAARAAQRVQRSEWHKWLNARFFIFSKWTVNSKHDAPAGGILFEVCARLTTANSVISQAGAWQFKFTFGPQYGQSEKLFPLVTFL